MYFIYTCLLVLVSVNNCTHVNQELCPEYNQWKRTSQCSTLCIAYGLPARNAAEGCSGVRFEWILVGPKGQGHMYVGAVATNFQMTAFIKMSENAPSCLLWSLTWISLHFCIDIVHLSTATVTVHCTSFDRELYSGYFSFPLILCLYTYTLQFLLSLGRFHY